MHIQLVDLCIPKDCKSRCIVYKGLLCYCFVLLELHVYVLAKIPSCAVAWHALWADVVLITENLKHVLQVVIGS